LGIRGSFRLNVILYFEPGFNRKGNHLIYYYFIDFNLEWNFTDLDILQKKAHNENYGL